jgi:hypothetical protein
MKKIILVIAILMFVVAVNAQTTITTTIPANTFMTPKQFTDSLNTRIAWIMSHIPTNTGVTTKTMMDSIKFYSIPLDSVLRKADVKTVQVPVMQVK